MEKLKQRAKARAERGGISGLSSKLKRKDTSLDVGDGGALVEMSSAPNSAREAVDLVPCFC